MADHAQERHDRLESPALEARARHARISAGQRDRAVSLDGGGRAATGASRRARDRPGGSGRAVRRSRQWIDGSRVPAHVARPRGTAPGGGADFSGARRARAVSARPDRSAKRRILLADADAFYVAVARLADPAGAGQARLLIVGGSPERRGVVTSASYEARAYGVHSAMPMARAVRLCPGATVVPVPWDACAAKSREIGAVLRRFTPAVEQASSDEFYLDLSGTEALYGDEALAATAHRIRQALTTETALSVSIGGGTSSVSWSRARKARSCSSSPSRISRSSAPSSRSVWRASACRQSATRCGRSARRSCAGWASARGPGCTSGSGASTAPRSSRTGTCSP
ncbi:MAG: hypothetical protein DMD67_17875 [Gemmatimonadetes bacterium]|nr:MAG: hypothetical protein DMD67_17875 [Gemmatimonadota bacterium]